MQTKQSEFNSRGGNKRGRPQRNGRYGDTRPEKEFCSRSTTGSKRNPGGSHGIMRD